MTNWSKILISRNPFERLFSAWNDKSRTFRDENGKLNFTKVELESTFLWGKENATHQEKLHIIFNQVRQQANHWKVYENLINKGSGFENIQVTIFLMILVKTPDKAKNHLMTDVSTGPIWSIMLEIINQLVMNITGSLSPIIVVYVKLTGYCYYIKKKQKLNMVG